MADREIKKKYGVIAHPLNSKLITELKAKGEDLLIIPEIRPTGVELTENELAAIKNPADFDWLIQADVFAADYFVEAMRAAGTDFFELDNLTVCAVGEAVADRLRFVQLHADIIPPRVSDEAIFSAISQYAGELNGIRFLIVRETSKTISFVDRLKKGNAVVFELPVYRAEFQVEGDLPKLKTLIRGGAVDEFIFSSAEDVLALKLFLASEDLSSVLADSKASATSEVAFQTLQENGLRPLYYHK